MPSTISTCGCFSTPNSRVMLVSGIARCFGRQTASAAAAAMPMPVTAQNVARQPYAWPSAVPSGTPSTFASVRPVNISAIACARRFGATRLLATTEPIPKNAPWQNAVTTRAAISTS